MPSAVRHVTFDCADPYQLAWFWSHVLGGSLHPDDQPGDPEGVVRHREAQRCFFNGCLRARPSRTGFTWTCSRREFIETMRFDG